MQINPQFGWINDPVSVNQVMGSLPYPHLPQHLYGSPHRSVYLFDYLRKCSPSWRRGAQRIGSCVAWGLELTCTTLFAKKCVRKGATHRFLEVATEPLYGLARVEGPGNKRGGWGDGAVGAWAAKAVCDYGVLFRRDYSKITGIDEHDLTVYNSTHGRRDNNTRTCKEKQWGNYGCGGQHDAGKLDRVAKDFPVREISQVQGFDDIAVAFDNDCPVTIASSFGVRTRNGLCVRDKYGQCYWTGSWNHQMCLLAIRHGSRPAGLCVQSWGPKVATGPTGEEYCDDLPPGGLWSNIMDTAWWIPAEVLDRICRSGDCWAIGDIKDWRTPKTDFSSLHTDFHSRSL